DLWESTGQEVASALQALGLPIDPVVTMETDDGAREALKVVREADKVKVVIMCMSSVLIGGEHQRRLLLAALDMGMISDVMNLSVVPATVLLQSCSWCTNCVMVCPELCLQVSPLFGTIFNMVYFVAKSMKIINSASVSLFCFFFQVLYGGKEGRGLQARYVVLDSDGDRLVPTHSLAPTHTDGKVGGLRSLGRSFVFPGGKPPTASFCWFSREEACTGGEFTDSQGLEYKDIFNLMLNCYFFFLYRCRLYDNGFDLPVALCSDWSIFPLDKRAPTSEYWRYTCTSTCMHLSVHLSLQFTDSVLWLCCYQGDWVWLKKVSVGKLMTALREMRHENLNLYLGLFMDCGIFALVVEHCPRGSLADLLADSNMRLDWMFKSSLLMDLIKGMKYLHLRGLSHGRLKSTNCLVDGRFVLKVTDYGLPMILYSQNLNLPEDPQELLWTSPELLRNPVRGGSFAGDVFSFSIITQEVISRTQPYAMMDMPAHEIIDRLKNPPPLCRPIISVDEAPDDCLSLMNECWNEDPNKRPSFDDIFKQFRGSNRGKRANIIDSMLRMLEQYSSNLEDLIRERTDELEVERNKTEKLIGQLLPKSVAQALKKGKPVQPEHYSDATLYFSDIVGFTTISALSDPIEVVDLLNDLYTMFDAIIATHDVYKVETIGDAYMVASGVPNRNGNRHAAEVANMSLDILHSIAAFKIRHMPEMKVKIRIGLHSGPVVAGVVGLMMPRYCLFGDTVTTASLMESSGLPYRIHISLSTVKVLTSLKLGYHIETRKAQVKGSEDTYWLMGQDGFTKPLPVPPDLSGGASNHGISLDEIPVERRQKFLDRQKKMKK
uniref:Guanylate cyclase n=1 Tax=Anabas testudineus TaxID=64144 RepID=A0A3Q1ISB7_ANATE